MELFYIIIAALVGLVVGVGARRKGARTLQGVPGLEPATKEAPRKVKKEVAHAREEHETALEEAAGEVAHEVEEKSEEAVLDSLFGRGKE